ncbi:hypothetical protein FGO68_gene14687 [Halteria grandinella]|uniref:Uncharacterized protein n=1 Tax=Halteria grandinella TaxID=5974 RepID=A0A8J8NVT0_HALGN|nr:hypothetical protein FGO68_gene14687 [Halteria grandinella]
MRIHAPHESEDSEESSEKPVITVIEPKIKRKIVVDRQQEFEDGQVHANVYQQNQSHQLVERVQSKVESKFSQQTIQQAKEKAAAQKPNISEKTQKKQHHITMEDGQKKPKEATNSKIDGVKPNGEAKHKIKEAEKLNLQNSAGGAIKKKHTQIAGKPSELKKTQVVPVPPGKEPQAQRTSKNAPKTLEPIPKKDAGATQIPKIKANSQFRVPDKDEPTTPVLTIQNVNSKLQNFRGGGLQSSLQKLQQNDLKQSKKEEAQANRMATKFVKQSSVGPQNNSQPQENSEFSENAVLQIKGKIQKKPDESLARNESEEDDQRDEQEPIPSSESGNNSSPEKAQNLLQLEEESESELEISSTVKKEMAKNPDDQESQRVKMDEADVQETSPNTNEVSHGDGSNIANVHKSSKLRQAAD